MPESPSGPAVADNSNGLDHLPDWLLYQRLPACRIRRKYSHTPMTDEWRRDCALQLLEASAKRYR